MRLENVHISADKSQNVSIDGARNLKLEATEGKGHRALARAQGGGNKLFLCGSNVDFI